MFSKINFVSLLCLICAMGVLTDDEKMSMEDMIATLEGIGASCVPPPTRKMIEQLMLHEENPPRETKCFARCMMEIFEMHSPDSNLLNEEKMVEFSNVMYPERTEDVRAIIKACNAKNAGITDKCDATYEHSMCMIHEAEERGVKMPMFE